MAGRPLKYPERGIETERRQDKEGAMYHNHYTLEKLAKWHEKEALAEAEKQRWLRLISKQRPGRSDVKAGTLTAGNLTRLVIGLAAAVVTVAAGLYR